MDQSELERCHEALGVPVGATLEQVERAFMQKNFALLKGKAGSAAEAKPELEAARQKLRETHDALAAQLREQPKQADATSPRRRPQLAAFHPPKPLPPPAQGFSTPPAPTRLLTPPAVKPRDPQADEFALFSFDNWRVNVIVPPLLLALAWVVTISPFGMLLKGFHVWMHEFGHAVPSWLSGWRATPLPFGWTPVEQEHSNFVYIGLLLMFGILFVAGWMERKVWAMILAVALAGLQYYMTWRLPETQKEFWMVFGGVGGEFALSTLFMMAFWVQLPEKFRWGACRYVFFLIGATAFINIWMMWGPIHVEQEEIPFGSMINGEEDAGGDMNRLMDDYGWKKVQIRNNFYVLGQWCWAALGLMYAAFALRLNKIPDWIVGKLRQPVAESAEA